MKREADRVFSIFIRMREADEMGMTKCFTCGVKKHWKDMQNSHFYSRSHMSIRWDEINCNVACMPCNVYFKGNIAAYALNLTRKYGAGILEKLEQKRSTILRMNRLEYEKLIAKYKTE